MDNKNNQNRRRPHRSEKPKSEYDQSIVDIRRVTRVVRGGRRFSFSLLLAAGNRRGKIGLGLGKSGDVAGAVEKALHQAKKNMLTLNLTKHSSIPHEVLAKYNSSRLFLRPSPGRGLAAGSAVRTILNLAGVKDVSAKILSKSKSKLNNSRVAMKALAVFAQK